MRIEAPTEVQKVLRMAEGTNLYALVVVGYSDDDESLVLYSTSNLEYADVSLLLQQANAQIVEDSLKAPPDENTT